MSYGTIQHDPMARQWVIKCVPHVAMRLKRLFGKIDARSQGEHRISDTPENARDLQWFTDRYPMDVRDRALLEIGASTHKDMIAATESLLIGRTPARRFEMAMPPRPYQSLAASVTLSRRGLLLADDVGLGKTASAICVLTDPTTRPAVVVTLTHLPGQWKAQLEQFAPGLTVRIAKSGKPPDLNGRQLSLLGGFPDVLLISYSKLATWAATLAKVCRSVIYDEVQELRRGESQRYAAAKHLSQAVSLRMGLSATPIYNYGGEMYSVLDCIFPGELGSPGEFAQEWCDGSIGEKASIKDAKAFSAYLQESGLMLRRTRKDVGRELPELQTIPFKVDTDTAALDSIKDTCAELARIILAEQETAKGQKMRASEEFSNKLRQATGVAKAPAVADFVRLLVESGEKVVLFGWHREVYSLWMSKLADLKPVLYTGSETISQKALAKQKFVDGQTDVLIISLRSGAGLDGLQHVCRTAVFGELDWSPGVHEQCIGRVNRDGQQEPVSAYFMLSDYGSDPIVAEILGLKKQQVESIRARAGEEVELVEQLQVDHGKIRRLAEAYLEKKQ